MLTSAALVVNAGKSTTTNTDQEERVKKLQEIIANPPAGESYSGCIIANNINNLELSYAPNETIVGIDFNGKPIKVIGETGRKVSTPIIESIDIDTDGANNTLKTAKVTVTCFTLKQLEMFELFFMKPGMNVMVEWGDNSLLMQDKFQLKGDGAPGNSVTGRNAFNRTGKEQVKTPFKRPEEALVINQSDEGNNRDYKTFCENFSKYFRSDTDALANYLTRIERSNGSYDLVAGKVIEYSFSVNADGTYSANFDVSQGNQMTQFVPKNARKGTDTSSEKTAGIDVSDEDTIKKQMAVDFDLDETAFRKMLTKHPDDGGNWMNDWFNFIKINKEQKDTVASSKSYVSLRFILYILMNYAIKEVQGSNPELVDDFFMLKLQKWMVDGKEKFTIPCNSSKFMFSSNEKIIYPLSNPPKFQAPLYTSGSNGKSQLKNPGDKNEIVITSDSSTNDTKIGGYDFHLNVKKLEHLISTTDENYRLPAIEIDTTSDRRLGDALNIFLNYDTVVAHWKRSYTRKDFLDNILSMCNDNSYGLFRLVYGNMGENGAPIKGPTIIDIKFKGYESMNPKKNEITYRFKPTTLKSIVKEFSFNFEMSNLVAGRTLFNSSKFLQEAIEKAKKPNEDVNVESLPLPPDAYKSVDNSTFGNADGWYSINNVELKIIEKKWDKAKKIDKAGGSLNEDPKNTEENKEATTEVANLNEVIKNNSLFFLINEKDDNDLRMLIFKDNPLIQGVIEANNKKNKLPTVSAIDITLTIDGFSGFNCGHYFNIDGIPEIYNQLGVFQIMNTKHNISKDGWTTTIEASHHYMNKKEGD
jgi:hypothetical protein